MNEFEWRRQLRGLRQPLTPQRDLWASIDAAIDNSGRIHAPAIAPTSIPRATRQRWLAAAGLAASLLLVVGISWHRLHVPVASTVAEAPGSSRGWKPADPRLAGAAIELHAARMELQLAIQQAPDSPALQRLLHRTELQQTQLQQLARQAG
jgi:hypothetical protein